MKKLTLLVMVVGFLVSGCYQAWWKPNTTYREAKEDVWRCHEEAWDKFKEGKISWDKEAKLYQDNCMKKKGYTLRDKEEAYPELGSYSQPVMIGR